MIKIQESKQNNREFSTKESQKKVIGDRLKPPTIKKVTKTAKKKKKGSVYVQSLRKQKARTQTNKLTCKRMFLLRNFHTSLPS